MRMPLEVSETAWGSDHMSFLRQGLPALLLTSFDCETYAHYRDTFDRETYAHYRDTFDRVCVHTAVDLLRIACYSLMANLAVP
jgi:hypothetical protein